MPITGGGGNIVDWGLLTALQGTSDWQQKRLDRNAELKYSQTLRDIAEAEKLKQQQAGAQLFNAFNEASKLQVLPPDTEKIKAKNDELIAPIKEGIKKYGGDVNMYLNSGGYNNLVKYSQDLQSSKEVKDALRRAKDFADYQNDLKSGKVIRPVYEEINGARQKYNPGEKIDQFMSGSAQDFSYNGGFDPFQADYRKKISEVYGSSDRKPRQATRDDVFIMAVDEAKKKGLSRDDAEYYSTIVADEYEKGVKAGTLTPYLFKSDNPLDDQVKQSTIEKNKASANYSNTRANKVASGGDTDPTNYWIQEVLAGGDRANFAIGDLIGANTGDGKIVNAEIITENTDFKTPSDMGMGRRNRGGDILPTKIKVTRVDNDGKEKYVVYDLTDANAIGELSTMQASKVTSKTFPKRSQEYQKNDGEDTQGQTFKTASGITYTVE